MTLGCYISGESFIHQLDPRTKIVSVIALIILAFKFHTLVWLMSLTVGLLLVMVSISGFRAIHLLRPLLPILLVVFLLNASLTPGQSVQVFLYKLGFITHEGILRGTFLAFRLISVVLITQLIMQTTSPMDLANGFQLLIRPLNKVRVPTVDLTLAFMIALRFVPILLTEGQRLYQAQRSRGANFSGWRRFQRLFPLILPLFVSAFTRAEHLAQALEARGYQSQHKRSQFRPLTLARHDKATIVIILVVTSFLFTL